MGEKFGAAVGRTLLDDLGGILLGLRSRLVSALCSFHIILSLSPSGHRVRGGSYVQQGLDTLRVLGRLRDIMLAPGELKAVVWQVGAPFCLRRGSRNGWGDGRFGNEADGFAAGKGWVIIGFVAGDIAVEMQGGQVGSSRESDVVSSSFSCPPPAGPGGAPTYGAVQAGVPLPCALGCSCRRRLPRSSHPQRASPPARRKPIGDAGSHLVPAHVPTARCSCAPFIAIDSNDVNLQGPSSKKSTGSSRPNRKLSTDRTLRSQKLYSFARLVMAL